MKRECKPSCEELEEKLSCMPARIVFTLLLLPFSPPPSASPQASSSPPSYLYHGGHPIPLKPRYQMLNIRTSSHHITQHDRLQHNTLPLQLWHSITSKSISPNLSVMPYEALSEYSSSPPYSYQRHQLDSPPWPRNVQHPGGSEDAGSSKSGTSGRAGTKLMAGTAHHLFSATLCDFTESKASSLLRMHQPSHSKSTPYLN